MTEAQEVPKQIGEYNISRILSSGVMGRTFMANVGNTHLAIKTYYPEYAEKLDYAPKFKEKHDVVHENLMPYIDIKYENKWEHVFVMHYLEVKPISYKRLYGQGHHAIIELFLKVADAVSTAHKAGITHCNIKPSNVLIRLEGKSYMPLVADFGIGYIYDEEYFTSPGNFTKVFPYMAPEAIDKFTQGGTLHELDPQADVYSLTTVLCEVLTGKPLFEGIEKMDELLEAKKNRKFRVVSVNYPVKKINVKKLNEFINANLSHEPEGRVPTMDAWKEGLAACLYPKNETVGATQ